MGGLAGTNAYLAVTDSSRNIGICPWRQLFPGVNAGQPISEIIIKYTGIQPKRELRLPGYCGICRTTSQVMAIRSDCHESITKIGNLMLSGHKEPTDCHNIGSCSGNLTSGARQPFLIFRFFIKVPVSF